MSEAQSSKIKTIKTLKTKEIPANKEEKKEKSPSPNRESQNLDNQDEDDEEYVDSSQLAEKKVLKRRIKPQADRLYPKETNAYDYQSNAGEYYHVNMEVAINYVLMKGKNLKDKIDEQNISPQFIQDNIVQNKHFSISYNSFLQKLINKKVLHPEFKNVKPKTLEKLEQFFIERIERCLESLRIHNAYHEKAKEIQNEFDKRIEELQNKIKQKNKINID